MDSIQSIINRSINDFGDRIFGRKYRLLDKIVSELDKSDICPDILHLGDSTVLRAANEDTDRRTTAGMLAGELKGKAHLLEISHGAYHMEIFFHILNMLKVTKHCPKLIIVPINIRSFSPQWHMQPAWQFNEEIELLKRYYQKKGLKRYYRRQNNQNGFENISVEYPLSKLRTVGDFERIRLNKEDLDISQDQRRKEIFIYFYLFQFSQNHPRLLKIKDIINLARNLNMKVLFYITPINIQAAIRSIGDEFNDYFSKSLYTVKNYIIEQNGIFLTKKDSIIYNITNDSVVCVDYSRSLESEYFFHSESIDEHLNQKGRGFISKQNKEIVLQMLG